MRLDCRERESQRPSHNFRYDIPTKIRAVPLSEQQRITLDKGQSVCFKDRTNSQDKKFDVYAIWSTQESKLNFYYEDPSKLDSYNERQQQQSQQSHASHYYEPSSSIGLFDLPADDSEDDPEETAFRRRMQQQQKKKRRGIRI